MKKYRVVETTVDNKSVFTIQMRMMFFFWTDLEIVRSSLYPHQQSIALLGFSSKSLVVDSIDKCNDIIKWISYGDKNIVTEDDKTKEITYCYFNNKLGYVGHKDLSNAFESYHTYISTKMVMVKDIPTKKIWKYNKIQKRFVDK